MGVAVKVIAAAMRAGPSPVRIVREVQAFTAIGSFQRKRGSLIPVEIKNMRQRSAIPHIVIAKNKNLTTLQASKNLLGVRSAAEREITEGINDVC